MVAYAPLGRGFLTGTITSPRDLGEDDVRRARLPRFQPDNLTRNLQLVHRLEDIARRLDATAGQVALAWVLAQGDDVVAIPGTRRIVYLEQNVAAADLRLTPDILEELDHARWVRARSTVPWARRVSNLRPLACEASALPLSYAPQG